MGPFKCPDCGVWWVGVEHRCESVGSIGGYRITFKPTIGGPDTLAPWCGICQSRHLPGFGPCTRTWSSVV